MGDREESSNTFAVLPRSWNLGRDRAEARTQDTATGAGGGHGVVGGVGTRDHTGMQAPQQYDLDAVWCQGLWVVLIGNAQGNGGWGGGPSGECDGGLGGPHR